VKHWLILGLQIPEGPNSKSLHFKWNLRKLNPPEEAELDRQAAVAATMFQERVVPHAE
jgi:hypothetical protein